MSELDDLLQGAVASEVGRALIRDALRRSRNGHPTAHWLQPVLEALEQTDAAASIASILAASGHPLVRVEAHEISVSEAARLAGLSERTVRRMAETKAILARRVGLRTWLLDRDSFMNVTKRRNPA